jgi:hypothetical protein
MIVHQSMSSVAAVYDRRLEKAGIRAVGEVARRICPAQAGQASGNERVSAGVRASYSPAKPLTENHNVVPSFSPGLAVQRPTPGNMSHKTQPLISRDCGPREARIRIAANSPTIQNSTLKIQHYFPHPPTHPHPKSTVDIRRKPLIKVENSLSPTCYRPIIRPENKGIQLKSNRHKPKNFKASGVPWGLVSMMSLTQQAAACRAEAPRRRAARLYWMAVRKELRQPLPA